MDKDEALKLALDVLESLPGFRADIDNAIDAIKEALAQPAQPVQPEQVQWLQSVTKKIEAALLSHRLSLHKDAEDDGVGYPLVDALCCGQKSLEFGKREVEDIVETIYHVLDANTPPTPAAQPAQEPFGYFKAEPFGWTDCAETDEGAKALYEAPPKREWVGLTQKEVQEIHDTYYKRMGPQEFASMLEAKLKEKNT